jgi:hypothetical protein
MPRRRINAAHTEETNWTPLSDVSWLGTPKRAIQPEMRASAQSAAAMLAKGMASAHRVDLSITVRMYCIPVLEVGRGPTKSMWMCVNLLVGTGMGSTAAAGCLVTLARAQC